MIVYKVLMNYNGRLYSTNKRPNADSNLRPLSIEYYKGLPNHGIEFNGEKSKLFAFTSLESAISFCRNIYSGEAEVYKCIASGVSKKIQPLYSRNIMSDYLQDNSEMIYIKDMKSLYNASSKKGLYSKVRTNPNGFWKAINETKKKHKKIPEQLGYVAQCYNNCVACDSITLLEKVNL